MKKLTLVNVENLKHWENFFSKYFKTDYEVNDNPLLIFNDSDTLIEKNHTVPNFIPSLNICKLFNDKYKTNDWLVANKFETIGYKVFQNSFITDTKIITKPPNSTGRYGFRVWEKGSEVCAQEGDLIQDFIEGTEYNLDILKDKNGDVYVCPKEKLLIKAGSTFQCKLNIDEELIHIGKQLASKIDYIGSIDVDIMYCMWDSTYYIIDINPRLGGGFLHSCNLDLAFEENIISILNGGVLKYKNNTRHDFISTIEYNFKLS